jgi:hypothetical protein
MRGPLLSLLFGTAAVLAPTAAAAETSVFSKKPVSDAELEGMRGGFVLPGGVDVSIAVQSDTRVNGVLMLRSVFVAHQGPPVLSVFGRTDPATGVTQTTSPGTASTTSITVGKGAAAGIGEGQDGLSKLDLAPGGAVEAAGGIVRIEKHGSVGTQIVLSSTTLDVRHLVGQAYGTIAANSGNDVAIDTSTTINLDVQNATPLNIGSAMLRVSTLGSDVAAALGGR